MGNRVEWAAGCTMGSKKLQSILISTRDGSGSSKFRLNELLMLAVVLKFSMARHD